MRKGGFFLMLDIIDKVLLKAVANLDDIPKIGAYNIRRNGKGISRQSTKNIQIVPKTDQPGIDINVAPGTKGEQVHIPVILSAEGMTDIVYNTFNIGDNANNTNNTTSLVSYEYRSWRQKHL